MEMLNAKQQEAVITTEGYLRVIAGAGSGKTKMLVNRYVYIIKELGISTKNILCLTFSNKAANEMKDRVKRILSGDPDVSFITTYHGFGARIIRENIDKMFLPNNFQIIDQIDQKSILSEIYDDLDLKLDSGSFEKIIDEIGMYKSDLKYIDEMIKSKSMLLDKTAGNLTEEIIKRYLVKQKKSFLVDFEDLINYALYLLITHKDIRNKWQDKLNYIQVDEFQDSTGKELKLVDLISDKYKNVMIVGDPDQNIYEWRGSQMELLIDYDINHIPTKTIVLNQNYRSTKKVLKCANTLIAHNKNRYPKDLFTLEEDGEDILYYRAKSDYHEADWIVSKIKYLKEIKEVMYSDIAILYRSTYSSRIIEKQLIENNIPYEIIGGIKFFQRMEIKDMIAYMRLVVHKDDSSLRRIINTPRRKFGKIKMAKLNALKGDDLTLYDALKDNIDVFSKDNNQIKEFVEMIENIHENLSNMNALEVFETLLDKSGYEVYIRELGNIERYNNLAEFKRVIMDLLKDASDVSIEECLQFFTLQADKEEDASEKVELMTIHASKGLEFKNVFVVGLSEGTFPANKTIEERQGEGLEEERRLCYVALTRARERLFLSNAASYVHEGAEAKKPSRFLNEIGEENYTSLGLKDLSEENDNKPKYSIGDTVIHRVLGPGKIVNINYQNNAYKIKFDKFEYERFIDMAYEFHNDNKKIEDSSDLINSTFKRNNGDLGNKIDNAIFNEVKEILENETNIIEEDDIFLEEREEIDEQDNENDLEVVNSNYEAVLNKDYKNINHVKTNLYSGKTNLWNDITVPKSGWICVGISDLGKPSMTCVMCENATIRYVHYMSHPLFPKVLPVGCICAGKMEGDGENAVHREKSLKNKVSRRNNFIKKKWNLSSKGHPYLKYKNNLFLMYKLNNEDKWCLYINGKNQNKYYASREEIVYDVFEYLDNIKMF